MTNLSDVTAVNELYELGGHYFGLTDNIPYFFIHTGILNPMKTHPFAVSNIGAGLSETLDLCIEAFLETSEYASLCQNYFQYSSATDPNCLTTSTFMNGESFQRPTPDLPYSSCTDYNVCPCPSNSA